MGGEDVVGEDLGGAGGGLQQADGALDGVSSQGRAGAGDVDELGEQDDDGVDAGSGAGDGDGRAAHVDVDVSEALLNGAQDLVPGTQEGHRGDVLRQGEGARDVLRFGGCGLGGGTERPEGRRRGGCQGRAGDGRVLTGSRLGGRGGRFCHRTLIILHPRYSADNALTDASTSRNQHRKECDILKPLDNLG